MLWGNTLPFDKEVMLPYLKKKKRTDPKNLDPTEDQVKKWARLYIGFKRAGVTALSMQEGGWGNLKDPNYTSD
jgi:hypothetical protein